MSEPNAPPLMSLADLLSAIGEDLDERDARRDEVLELYRHGSRHIAPDLCIQLVAECASRGVDWQELLADAMRTLTRPALPN